MKHKKAIWSGLVAVTFGVLAFAGRPVHSTPNPPVQPASAFLWVGAGSGDQLVVAYSSCSLTNVSYRYGTSLATATQDLRDRGLRLVGSDGLLLRFEAP